MIESLYLEFEYEAIKAKEECKCLKLSTYFYDLNFKPSKHSKTEPVACTKILADYERTKMGLGHNGDD